MTFRPSPSLLSQSKYRSLWHYAISATLDDVRRRLWSWTYFAARRDVRKRYLEENFRRKRYVLDIPDDVFNAGLNRIRGLCTLKETRFYESICQYRYLTLPYHWYVALWIFPCAFITSSGGSSMLSQAFRVQRSDHHRHATTLHRGRACHLPEVFPEAR